MPLRTRLGGINAVFAVFLCFVCEEFHQKGLTFDVHRDTKQNDIILGGLLGKPAHITPSCNKNLV
jgi:hypothetical protein